MKRTDDNFCITCRLHGRQTLAIQEHGESSRLCREHYTQSQTAHHQIKHCDVIDVRHRLHMHL